MTIGVGTPQIATNPNGGIGLSISVNLTIGAGEHIHIWGTGTSSSAAVLSCGVTLGGVPQTVSQIGSTIDDTVNHQQNAQWCVVNPGAGTYVVTIAVSAGAFPYVGVGAIAITGAKLTSPVVGNAGQFQNGPGAGAGAVTSGAVSPAPPYPCLAIGFTLNNAGAFAAPTAVSGTSIATGWQWELTQQYMRVQSQRLTSGTAQSTFTVTSGGGGSQYTTMVAVYEEAGAASTPDAGLMMAGVSLTL